jgi:lipid II:glycine glycyltransferase (peptidoglycan interpeptide bridge formation enzyme)
MSFYFRDKSKIYVSYLDDVPQTAVIFLGNEYCTYALYAGSIIKAFRGANSYLDWEAILEAKKCNSSYFDFVGARINPEPGSKLERIQNYKSRFGSEFVQGYLWKMVISKRKYFIYKTILKIYFLLKNNKIKKDIIDQEFEKQNNEDIHSDS